MKTETLQRAMRLHLEIRELEDHIKDLESEESLSINGFRTDIIPTHQIEFKSSYIREAKKVLKSIQLEFENLKD